MSNPRLDPCKEFVHILGGGDFRRGLISRRGGDALALTFEPTGAGFDNYLGPAVIFHGSHCACVKACAGGRRRAFGFGASSTLPQGGVFRGRLGRFKEGSAPTDGADGLVFNGSCPKDISER